MLPKNRLILSGELLVLGLLMIWTLGISGCMSLRQTVNISRELGLAQANRLEIAELIIEPQARYELRLTVSDPAVLRQLNVALDTDLQLEPQVDCVAQYRLNFVLAGGDVQTLYYDCAGGESFLTGTQTFWSEQQVQPPAGFDAVVSSLLQTSAN